MKELQLSVYTNTKDKDGTSITNSLVSTVVLNAKFDTHNEAVAFHDDIAAVCQKHSVTPEMVSNAKFFGGNLLGYKKQ